MSLSLAGCAGIALPSYRLGDAEVPDSWAQPRPAGTAVGVPWWREFDDALLVQLVESALASNTDVGVARASLLQARALRVQAASALWPTVSATASAQRLAPSGGSSGNNFQAGFDAAWEADLFGGNREALAAQESLVGASGAALAATQLSVAAEVVQSYLDLRGAQARAAVARENLSSQQETLQISEWRQQAGLANAVEVEQARAAVEQTRSQVPALEASAAQSAHALAVLTGRAPALVYAVLAAPAGLPQPRATAAVDAPAQVLLRRPDVLAAELRLQSAAHGIGEARAARLPALQFNASLAWSGLTLGSLGAVSAARSALASLAQPLFDAGARRARVDQREAEYLAARENYRAAALHALQDVEDALVALSSGRERLVALQAALEAARNAALLATQRHASGLIDFQTVLETQRTLLNVQDSVVTAQAALASAHVRLYKALGGGWQPDASTRPT